MHHLCQCKPKETLQLNLDIELAMKISVVMRIAVDDFFSANWQSLITYKVRPASFHTPICVITATKLRDGPMDVMEQVSFSLQTELPPTCLR